MGGLIFEVFEGRLDAIYIYIYIGAVMRIDERFLILNFFLRRYSSLCSGTRGGSKGFR